jgi:hypothetical protein
MELAKLSDQAKPFYEWIEKIFKIETNSHKTLNEIIFDLSKDELKKCVRVCFYPPKDKSSTPFLFDGI